MKMLITKSKTKNNINIAQNSANAKTDNLPVNISLA